MKKTLAPRSFCEVGFTLIEILVVATITVLLTASASVGYSQFLKQSRDAKRKADIEQVRAALEMYRSNNDTYPVGDSYTLTLSVLTSGTVYIKSLPTDPKSNSYFYSGTVSDYKLGAYLETGTAVGCATGCTIGTCNYCAGPYGVIVPAPTACFTGTMKVLIPFNDAKPIRQIKSGDYVLSYNTTSRILEPDKVIRIYYHNNTDGFLRLILNNHTILEVTSEHPILKADGSFVKAKDLKEKDKIIVTSNHTETGPEIIYSIIKINQSGIVYNLETEKNHTFVVEGIVVHNKVPVPTDPGITLPDDM